MRARWRILAGIIAAAWCSHGQAQQPQNQERDALTCVASLVLTRGLSPGQSACFRLLFTGLSHAGGSANANGSPQPIPRPQSIADVGVMLLKCYHPTGVFQTVQVIDYPWHAQQRQWNASDSVLLDIRWHGGFVGNQYRTVIGLVQRQGQIRAVIQGDNAAVPASNACVLNNWIQVSGT